MYRSNSALDSCGAPGPFFLDAGISSTQHIAGFWDLGEDLVEDLVQALGNDLGIDLVETLAPDITSQPHQLNNGSRAVVKVERVDGRINLDQDFVNRDVENHPRPYDPTVVIAAALKAAGLPVPKFPAGSTGATFAPGPIIEAALKAAGLKLL